jgi:hypothetical protein
VAVLGKHITVTKQYVWNDYRRHESKAVPFLNFIASWRLQSCFALRSLYFQVNCVKYPQDVRFVGFSESWFRDSVDCSVALYQMQSCLGWNILRGA